MKPILQFLSTFLVQLGATNRARSLQFMLNTANDVIQLRRQAGASQVLIGNDDTLNFITLDCHCVF